MAATISQASLARDAWKARAVPWNSAWMDAGRPTSALVLLMASTASPSDTRGARLNDTVTAGNWPWRLMARGVVVISGVANALSGTGPPAAALAGLEPPGVELPPAPPPAPADPPAAWR